MKPFPTMKIIIMSIAKTFAMTMFLAAPPIKRKSDAATWFIASIIR
jgi:hypothetical protein